MEREVYCLCELMRGKRERKEFNNSLRKDLVWEAVMGISLWIVQVIILYWVKIKYTKRSQVSWVSIWDSGLLWSWCLWGINQQWLPAEALLRINPLSTLTALCLCGYCVFMCWAPVLLWSCEKCQLLNNAAFKSFSLLLPKPSWKSNNKQTWTSSKGSRESFF